MEDISWFLYSAGYLMAAVIVLFVAKKVFDLLTPFSVDVQLTEKDNPALGVMLGGFLLAVICVISGSFAGESSGTPTFETFLDEMKDVGIYGGLGILGLFICGIVCDKVVLRKFSMRDEVIANKNVPVSLINAAYYVGSGLIIAGGIYGASSLTHFAEAFVAGQVALILFCIIYQVATSYDDQDELANKRNLAVGFAFGGNILAFSLVVMKGVLMPAESSDWSPLDRLHHFGYFVVAGCVLLLVTRFVNDRIFMPKAKLAEEVVKDQNVNAGLMEAGLALSMGLVLVFCL